MRCQSIFVLRWCRIWPKGMRWFVAMLALWGGIAQAQPAPPLRFEEDYETKGWTEITAEIPPYPKPGKLIPFKVTASNFEFFVDADSLSVAKDGVVRFTLVAMGAGGGENVTYEGIRCSTRERRTYAFGRPDQSWSKARSNAWTLFDAAGRIPQYITLASDYFCPGGTIIRDPKEGIDALQWGHPRARR